MNIVYTLERLGYNNGVDFEYRKSTGLVWLSNSPKPSESELQESWNNFIASDALEILEQDRKSALSKIDGLAGIKRMEYISNGAGQDLVYNEKVKEAEEFIANGYVNVEQYPFIQKEAEALGLTPSEIADTIMENKTAWVNIGSEIEKVRMANKKLVREASSREEIADIIEQVKLELKAI